MRGLYPGRIEIWKLNVSFFILVSESENTHHSFQNLSEASMIII